MKIFISLMGAAEWMEIVNLAGFIGTILPLLYIFILLLIVPILLAKFLNVLVNLLIHKLDMHIHLGSIRINIM